MIVFKPYLALSATDEPSKCKCLFFSRGKPVESSKDDEESDYSEIEENYHKKISKRDKSQSATNKESNKARINTSSVFKWNTSILHASKDIRMAHENK